MVHGLSRSCGCGSGSGWIVADGHQDPGGSGTSMPMPMSMVHHRQTDRLGRRLSLLRVRVTGLLACLPLDGWRDQFLFSSFRLSIRLFFVMLALVLLLLLLLLLHSCQLLPSFAIGTLLLLLRSTCSRHACLSVCKYHGCTVNILGTGPCLYAILH